MFYIKSAPRLCEQTKADCKNPHAIYQVWTIRALILQSRNSSPISNAQKMKFLRQPHTANGSADRE